MSNANKASAIETATKLRDKMFAHSLSGRIKGPSFFRPTISPCLTNIPAGYMFLMQNCQLTAFSSLSLSYHIQLDKRGDKICIFGFSHGTCTSRALAGMLHKVGLLPQSKFELLGLAYRMYKNRDAKNLENSRRFKQTYCIDVRIEFLGVWYVVQAIGRLPISSLCVGTP